MYVNIAVLKETQPHEKRVALVPLQLERYLIPKLGRNQYDPKNARCLRHRLRQAS